MVEKLCKNCKHWKRETESYEDKRFGYCGHDKFIDNSYGSYWEEKNKCSDDSVLFSDYEGYAANFRTGQNFGCVHFEEGETK